MNNSNKILFISRTMPFPIQGGDLIVLDNIMKALSESEIEADLLCFTRKNDDVLKIKNVKEKLGFKNVFYSQIESKINARCVFDWLFKEKSYIFNRFYSKKFSKKLLELVKTGEYSTLVFEHSFMYVNLLFNPILKEEIKIRNIKTVINSHVLEYFVLEQTKYLKITGERVAEGDGKRAQKLTLATSLEGGGWGWVIKKFFIKKEQKFIKKIELDCIKNADKTVFLGHEELERVQTILPEESKKFHLLEMTPFINNYPYSQPEFEEKNSIYFLGTFSWVQNHDAVMYFVREIFPLILRKNPEIKFYLVGMNAGKDIKSLHDGKNIFFVGEKDDIFKEIKKYSVLIVPLRLKGGTRIKILESIAWGKAIISASSGMEGVNTYGESPVLIADTAEDFAQKVLELVSDDDLRIKIKENARNFAESHYSFEKFKESVLKVFM